MKVELEGDEILKRKGRRTDKDSIEKTNTQQETLRATKDGIKKVK